MERPLAIVLDVNETLFSLDALQPVFDALGLSDERDLWFARTLRNGFALTALGEYRTFPEVATRALESLRPGRVSDEDADALMAAFGRLQPHSDVPDALNGLHAAGIPVVTLSVGNASNVERLFDAAGLAHTVVEHLSCSSVRRWKPAPEPYLYACERLGLPPGEVWMVAAHAWDVAGAKAVGMNTAWIARLEQIFDPNFGPPDVQAADLEALVREFLAA